MKKILSNLVIVCVVLFILSYLAFFGFSLPPCAERDIIHPIPPHLLGAVIKFESNNVVGWKFSKSKFDFAKHCTSIGKQETGYITDGRRGTKYFSPDEGLKLQYILTRKCETLYCFDSGGTSLYLILEDEKGRLWENLALSPDWQFKPVYYQSGKPQGELHLENYFSPKDGLLISR